MNKLFAIVIVGLLLSCSERRGITPSFTSPETLSYTADMKPMFDASCITCHGSTSPSGNYSLATYAGVLGNGSDATPNAIPGDANSLIITKIQSGHSSWASDATKLELLIQWVVEDSLREN